MYICNECIRGTGLSATGSSFRIYLNIEPINDMFCYHFPFYAYGITAAHVFFLVCNITISINGYYISWTQG